MLLNVGIKHSQYMQTWRTTQGYDILLYIFMI